VVESALQQMGEKSSPIRPIEILVIEDSPVDIYQKKIASKEISAPSRLNVVMDEQTAVDLSIMEKDMWTHTA
jgi:hypothetical protein